jgi:hypothetical protein
MPYYGAKIGNKSRISKIFGLKNLKNARKFGRLGNIEYICCAKIGFGGKMQI